MITTNIIGLSLLEFRVPGGFRDLGLGDCNFEAGRPSNTKRVRGLSHRDDTWRARGICLVG